MRLSVTITAVILVVFSATASAQTPAADIRGLLKNGEHVSITDDQGKEFRGRVVSLTTESLTLAQGRERLDLRYENLTKIKHVDGLKNGALIGLGTGAVLGVLLTNPGDCDPVAFFCGDPSAGNYAATALVMGGLGAAIGTGVDALFGGNHTIYRRATGRITLYPAFTPRRAATMVAVTW